MISLDRDQGIGGLIFIVAILGIIVYGLLLWNPWFGSLYTTTVLAITAFLAVALALGILGWIGWTMARTPPPPPLESPNLEPTDVAEPESKAKKSEKVTAPKSKKKPQSKAKPKK